MVCVSIVYAAYLSVKSCHFGLSFSTAPVSAIMRQTREVIRMGYIRRPAYYKAFRCIGSDCTENCCIGWEIDVDEDSLACYETVPGDFGERLRASIAPADAQTGEPAHFRLDAEERCPLLNDCNLCEVLLTLGEDKMAQICTDHPRYYEWFSDGREDGLGLCCEAAAELILAQTGAPAFDVTEADGVSETGTEAETELENVLFSMRDALFRLACEDAPFDDKADRLYRTAKAQQEQYDDLLFPFPEDEDADETDEDAASWSQAFWRESTLTSLLEMLLGFEINKDDWRTLLTGAKARLPEIIACRNDFLQAYQGKRHEYDNLLTYFLYRHFMKALGDDAVQDKVQLALVSTAVIQLLDVYEWLAKGEVTHWAQICICKAYSREIEYNEDNTEQLAAFSVLDEME